MEAASPEHEPTLHGPALMTDRRLVVVANRLPVTRDPDSPHSDWRTSPGGLVSALAPMLQAADGAWVGWAGGDGSAPRPFHHDGLHLRPVPLTAPELEDFYQGFSNSTLWPLYHDAVRWPEFHRHWWRPYVEVNRRFAEAAADALREGDTAWIHDYHLQLVPGYLRELRPDVKIGFFLHIPFPPVELFAQIPWRRQLLEGLLGADLVGFQTLYGAKNFTRAVRRFTDARGAGGTLEFRGRGVQVGAFPISIDVERFEALARRPDVIAEARRIRETVGAGGQIILGVDRLDYTKGIDHRMRAFETLLELRGKDAPRVTYVQIAVPSRELVPQYGQIRSVVEQLVGHVNGAHGTAGHMPLQYMYRSLSTEDLVSYYLAADVMAVTPLRDGMNLVAKEYVATRLASDGVLVLSEFAGSAHELKRALMVNPHDLDGMAHAFQEALAMPAGEIRQRMASLRRIVGRSDVHAWAQSFLGALTR